MERDLLDKMMGILDEFMSKDFLRCIELRWIPEEDTLVVYIDSTQDPKVTIDLLCCESIHRKIFKDEALNLELSKIIKKDFNLEISSPGINRPLRKVQDFKDFIGTRVKIKTGGKLGKKKFLGSLKGVDEALCSIEVGVEEEKQTRSFKIKDLESVEVLSE